jgi:hypothetical protein
MTPTREQIQDALEAIGSISYNRDCNPCPPISMHNTIRSLLKSALDHTDGAIHEYMGKPYSRRQLEKENQELREKLNAQPVDIESLKRELHGKWNDIQVSCSGVHTVANAVIDHLSATGRLAGVTEHVNMIDVQHCTQCYAVTEPDQDVREALEIECEKQFNLIQKIRDVVRFDSKAGALINEYCLTGFGGERPYQRQALTRPAVTEGYALVLVKQNSGTYGIVSGGDASRDEYHRVTIDVPTSYTITIGERVTIAAAPKQEVE